MQVYGTKGKTNEIKLSKTGKNCFERGQTDVFGFENPDIGELTKLRIGHVIFNTCDNPFFENQFFFSNIGWKFLWKCMVFG